LFAYSKKEQKMEKNVRTKNNPQSEEDQTISRPAETPSDEEIALRAYEIYVDRGQADGRDLDDWLEAKRELTSDLDNSETAWE
jgi:hypothetical protein